MLLQELGLTDVVSGVKHDLTVCETTEKLPKVIYATTQTGAHYSYSAYLQPLFPEMPGQPGIMGFSFIDAKRRSLFFSFPS